MERLRAVTGHQINFCLKFSAVCVEVWKKRGLPCRLDLFVVYKAEAHKQFGCGPEDRTQPRGEKAGVAAPIRMGVFGQPNSRSVRFILRKSRRLSFMNRPPLLRVGATYNIR